MGRAEHIAELERLTACLMPRLQRMERSYSEWKSSPWRALKVPGPGIFGSLVEDVVREWLGADPAANTQHDLRLGSMRIELKGSTSKRNRLAFAQIRTRQDYTHVLLIGFFPHDIRGWLLTKEAATLAAIADHHEDVRFIGFSVMSPPHGAFPTSGALDELRALLPAGSGLFT